MLKFFFNRESVMVRLMEILGVVTFSVFVWQHPQLNATLLFLSFVFACYLFIRLCDSYPWHGSKNRHTGIRVHFQKAIVPAAYIVGVTNLSHVLSLPYLPVVFLVLACLMMCAITPVNAILVYFYLKDKDPLPINYFSSNAYLLPSPQFRQERKSAFPTDDCTKRAQRVNQMGALSVKEVK